MTRKQISLCLVDKNMRRNKEVYLASFSNISPSPVFERIRLHPCCNGKYMFPSTDFIMVSVTNVLT